MSMCRSPGQVRELSYLLAFLYLRGRSEKRIFQATNVVGDTMTGAASGENANCIAEGFKISGKRTEENKRFFCCFRSF